MIYRLLLCLLDRALLARHRPVPMAARADRYQRRQAPARRVSSPVRRTLFHAPSFSAGVVMGAVVVLGAAYLPELLGSPARDAGAAVAAPADSRPTLTFEFDHLLRNSEVAVDPEPYVSAPRVRRSAAPAEAAVTEAAPTAAAPAAPGAATQPAPATATAPPAAAPPETFMLQAASFRSRDDAERLRAALLLLDLPASTTTSSLPSGVWHRVTVGPFHSRAQAERALTRLREHNIDAIWSRT
jgi:cell division protein FtsN